MIVGLVSSYREGRLIVECVRSLLDGCEFVFVAEGPVADGGAMRGAESDLSPFRYDFHGGSHTDGVARWIPRLRVSFGEWEDDAAKRSWLLERAKATLKMPEDEPLWIVWLDGDEVLLWPHLLPDWIARAQAEGDLYENATGGIGLRLCELDGTVAIATGKVIRGDLVARYLVSSYQVELRSGMIVALPYVPVCGPGSIPFAPDPIPQRGSPDENRWLSNCRPPVAGEPHILHRSILRPPGRDTERLHDAEADWFTRLPDVQAIERNLP